MSIRAVVRTTHAGRHILECGIEEEFEAAADAFARLDELKPLLGIETGTITALPTVAAKRWSRIEYDAIAGAKTPGEAIRMYRAALPGADRTDAGILKQHRKLSRYNVDTVTCGACGIPRPAISVDEFGMCPACEEFANAPDKQATEGAAAPTPVPAGDEVTLHEPVEEVPEQEPIKKKAKKKAYKNAWTPEEDDIVRDAPSSEDAARLHAVAFPGKRTPAAIDARWRKFNPSTLQKLKEVAAPNPDLPERGANVLIVGPAGRCTGKTGTVIRRDQRIGEILVNVGADGCVWMKPGHVEEVSE